MYHSRPCKLVTNSENSEKPRISAKVTSNSAPGCCAATRPGVECGHTVPSILTVEKYARALEIPLYKLFHEGEEPPKKPKLLSYQESGAAVGCEREGGMA